MRIPDMPLAGMGIKGDAFTQGFRKLVKRAGIEWFVFHDIQAKGVSDFTGDKRKAGGHKSEKMFDIYDRKRLIIDATEY